MSDLIPAKLSNSAALGLAYSVTQYSTRSPFNCDGSKILVLEPSNFSIYDGVTLSRIGPLVWLGDSMDPLWSRTDPNLFYYHPAGSSAIYSWNVATGKATLIRAFTEYSSITFGNGEGDISVDGDHLAIVGTTAMKTVEIFVFQISANIKGPVIVPIDTLDSAYITPDLNLLLAYGSHGIFLFNPSTGKVTQVADADGHHDVMLDSDGSEVMIWDNSASPSISARHIMKVRLSDGLQTPLLGVDWATLATDISCPKMAGGFCIVSTYDPKNPASTVLNANAILRVPLDGSAAAELLKHGSNSATYNGQPRASIAANGSRLVYNSNMDGPVTDVYIATLAGPTPPDPPTVPMFAFPNQEPLTAANFPAAPGQAGFVYDGGDNVKVIYNDGAHKWAVPMTEIGND